MIYILGKVLISERTRPVCAQTGQVKAHPTCTTSFLSSSSSAPNQRQVLNSKSIVQGPPLTDTIRKDLYTIEQDKVGPPGQRRIARKKFPSFSTIPSMKPSPSRISDRSIDPPIIPIIAEGSRQFKRNVSSVNDKIIQS